MKICKVCIQFAYQTINFNFAITNFIHVIKSAMAKLLLIVLYEILVKEDCILKQINLFKLLQWSVVAFKSAFTSQDNKIYVMTF